MLHEKIRAKMREQNIGNNELSEMSGIPIGTLNKILLGISTNPKYSNIEAIARALGCSIDDFSDQQDNESDSDLESAIKAEGRELVEIINQMPSHKRTALIEFLKVFSQP